MSTFNERFDLVLRKQGKVFTRPRSVPDIKRAMTLEESLGDPDLFEGLANILRDGDAGFKEGLYLGFIGQQLSQKGKIVANTWFSDTRSEGYKKGLALRDALFGFSSGLRDGLKLIQGVHDHQASQALQNAYRSGNLLGLYVKEEEDLSQLGGPDPLKFHHCLRGIGIRIVGDNKISPPVRYYVPSPVIHERKHMDSQDQTQTRQATVTVEETTQKPFEWKKFFKATSLVSISLAAGGIIGFVAGRKTQAKIGAAVETPPTTAS